MYKKISLSDAENMFRTLKELQEHVLFLEPFEIYLDSATKIAIDEKITIYDALYIAQAKRYGEFITSDKKQGNVAKKKGINVRYIE